MNPIRLMLKNFRNYKSLDLSFDYDGVMPIVGKNGHGKSTIFYGILLGLYGKVVVDGIEVPTKDLIVDDGSKEMEVKYTFSHEDKMYRVERVYKISVSKQDVMKCDQVKCEFYQIFGDSETSLGAKSKNITTEKIISILGKDCDNFCNSAFFPQGEESRLAKLKPAEFIEEISKLKKITIWEELREKCKKELDNVESMLSGVNSYIEECKEDISRKGEIQQEIKQLNEKLVLQRERVQGIEQLLESTSDKKSELNNTLETIDNLEKDIKDIKVEIAELKDDIDFSDNKIKEAESILVNKDSILLENQMYQDLCSKKEALDKVAMNRTRLLGDISSIEREVQLAESKANQSLNELVTRKNSALSILENLNQLQNRYNYCIQFMQSLESAQQEYDSLNKTNQDLIIEITKLNSRNEQLLSLIKEETDKTHRIIGLCMCSECERPIDDNGLEQIKKHKAAKIDSYKAEGRANEEKIGQLNDIMKNNQCTIDSLSQQLSQREACSREIGQLQNQLSTVQAAEKELQTLEPQIIEIQGIINNKGYSDKVEILESLKENLASTLYNEEEHSSINTQCSRLQNIGIKIHELNEAEKVLPDLKKKIEEFNGRLKAKEDKHIVLSEKLNKSNKDTLISTINKIKEQEISLKNELVDNRGIFDSLMKEFGGKQSILENILYKENKVEEKIKEVKDIKNRQYLLERAIDMYSKQGIPTLIIESMLPDIEKEANQLLQTMGAERTICFDRPKRADGSYMDKILVMVRDRRGKKRTFNTFSGAECFQISFALRVAICGSEDVMFIDEGFGKLDSDNMDSIVKTLGALKTKFSKIILITHVEKLIDMFSIKLKVELDNKGYSKAKWLKD